MTMATSINPIAIPINVTIELMALRAECMIM